MAMAEGEIEIKSLLDRRRTSLDKLWQTRTEKRNKNSVAIISISEMATVLQMLWFTERDR